MSISFWHRTCVHAAERIDLDMTLKAAAQPVLGRVPMIWLTTQRDATWVMLGLSSHTLSCNRMAALYQVVPEDHDKVMRWGDVMMAPSFQPLLPGARRLMAVRGTRPGVWAVSLQPLHVERCQ